MSDFGEVLPTEQPAARGEADLPSSRDRPSTALGRGWFATLLILFAFLLHAFAGIINDAVHDDLQAQSRQVFNRADHLLLTVERELPAAAVLNRSVDQVLARHRCEKAEERQIVALQTILRRRLHRSVQMLWFDQQGNILNVGAPGFGGGQTVWKALWKLIQAVPDLTQRDQSLARNLVLSFFGRIMPLETLYQAVDHLIPLYFAGRPHFFGLLRFRDQQDRVSASCFLLLPVDALPQDWTARRAVRLGSSARFQAGAWRFSRQEEVAPSPLEPNLLPGLAKTLLGGQSTCLIGNDYYLSRISATDPDLMLTIRIVDGAPSSWLPEKIPFHWWAAALFAVSLVVAARFLPSFDLSALSLRKKMIIGGAFLMIPPMPAMMIFGYSQAQLMNDAGAGSAEARLDQRLKQIENAYVDAMFRWQSELQWLMKQEFVVRGEEENRLRTYLDRLIPWRGYRYYYYHRSGRRYSFSPTAHMAEKEEHLRYIATMLKSADFEFPIAQSLGSASGALSNLMSGFQMPESKWEDVVGRLAPSEVGDADWLTFPAFAYDGEGRKSAFLFFGLHRPAMRHEFLRVQQQRQESDVEVRIDGFARIDGTGRRLIDRAVTTGRTQCVTLSQDGRARMLLARPLRGLNVCALAAMDLERQTPGRLFLHMQLLLLAATVLLSIGVAVYLRRRLYEPIAEISSTIPEIEAGVYGYRSTVQQRDELQALAEALEQLGSGLEQKSRMQSFVRPDLVRTLAQTSGRSCRVRAAILFAGLRGFSALEAALTPEDALETMGRFLALVEEAVTACGGQIDKFIGDAAMVIFLPASDADSVERRALEGAAKVYESVKRWNHERKALGLVEMKYGVGIAVGDVLTGSVGSRRRRLDFTAIGDVVNLAARLEKLGGKDTLPPIVGTGDVCRSAPDGWFWQATGIREVRGRVGETPVYAMVKEGDIS